ncbi:MAG: prephenate dehydrogenase/arogenate dehydrogenase family protein [Deltaproteobacteria bacterium]|jgi:prephenate dehydratase/prephenate dehydrogenase|nr:prephenate dehydrogenase/arogenate dehydrogenase family protein [Deltaproteobacteria bacterium]
MKSIATLGPEGSSSWQAAKHFDPDADIKFFPNTPSVIKAFLDKEADLALIPVYNTREGESIEYFRIMEKLSSAHWIDNVVLPIHLSLGAIDDSHPLSMLIGKSNSFRQCDEYITNNYPMLPQLTVTDLQQAINDVKQQNKLDNGFVATEEFLVANGLIIREREMAPHNQTRFAVISSNPSKPTGYDATALLTLPLNDRVGLLVDILSEFTRRGINIIDMRTESDIKTQKLQIYIEAEGHILDKVLADAVKSISEQIIQEPGAFQVLGSFPRVDMRTKHISSFGFIGTGDMSQWFAKRLESEGYTSMLTGRTTKLKPEEMIPQVDVVVICVPISATTGAVEMYGPLLKDGQALIILAGVAETSLDAALAKTRPGVEVMLVHNLWGPQAKTMKDKNATVVRTKRSGLLCSEFEAFLYKHGALINQDSPSQHDLLMGVGQKLPTTISVALAMTLKDNQIPHDEIGNHSTLTSLYGILAMARVHTQNARTYAEIMATKGDGRKIVKSFAENLIKLMDIANEDKIEELCAIIDENKNYLTDEFLKARMNQSLAVDETLGRIIRS